MDSGQPSHGLWKKIGFVLGAVRAMDSIGIGLFLTILFWVSFELIGVALLIFIIYLLNLAASIVWLYAIIKKKSRLLLAALIWWTIPLLISLILIISVLSSGSRGTENTTEQFEQKGIARSFNDWLKVLVVVGGVLSLLFYGIALKSYAKMKEAFDGDASEIQGLGVGYTPKNKTTDLNIY